MNNLGLADLAQGIQNLIERKNIENKPEFVLSTESSYPFFQEYILKFGPPEIEVEESREEENLRSAFDLFKGLVSGIVGSINADTSVNDDEKMKLVREKLIKFRNSVLDLKVIFVKLDDEGAVQHVHHQPPAYLTSKVERYFGLMLR